MSIDTNNRVIALVIAAAVFIVGGFFLAADDGSIADTLSALNVTQRGVEADEEAVGGTAAQTAAVGSSASGTIAADGTVLVRYTKSGFEPFIVEVEQGQAVTFRNETNLVLQITTKNHPTASAQPFPGFDNSVTLSQGEEWSIPLTYPGVFGYKNQFNEAHLGAVVVMPQQK